MKYKVLEYFPITERYYAVYVDNGVLMESNASREWWKDLRD